MAITTMPPRSSATANAARNIFRPSGTRVLNTESTPSENAMSVAIGIAIPRIMSASAGQVSQNSNMGTSIPPQAPMIGNIAFWRVESSPTRISLFISSPTDRKNIAIRKSLITIISDMLWPPWLKRLNSPIENDTSFCHNAK